MRRRRRPVRSLLFIPAAANRRRMQHARRDGKRGEALVRDRLTALGIHCVAPVETGWIIRRVGARIVGATPKAKVAGDFYGLLAGRGVLVEAKSRATGNLPYSALDEHQHRRLAAYDAAGGLALVAWVRREDVLVMPWTFVGQWLTGPRTSITWADAVSIAIKPTKESA